MNGGYGIGETVLSLAEQLRRGDLLYLADDEQEAEALADALAALAPENPVIFLPSSDTLPGDAAPASPANIGRRISALRELRRIGPAGSRPNLAAILSGEAAARLYAHPSAFDTAPPCLRQGDRIDTENFAAEMEAIGYVEDDRVDEPGEVAVRGEVIDIFPADAGFPARIEVTGGRIAGIRHYDPVTQLTQDPCETLEIGRACEPDAKKEVTILTHLSPGQIAFSPNADKRRQRFIRLAEETAGSSSANIDAASEELWTNELENWQSGGPVPTATAPVPRFAQQRAPLAALKRFALPHLNEGKVLLLVGGARDVRFLRSKLARTFGADIQTINAFEALQELQPGGVAALIAPIDRGAMCGNVLMVSAADLLGSRAIIGDHESTFAAGPLLRGVDVRTGDLVVHEEHGIARVIGLEQDPGTAGLEVIALEYGGGDRRLVPVHEAGRLWRYGADSDAVKLDKLDGTSWAKRRGAIDEAVAESARELLRLAHQRGTLKAPALDPGSADYERFVAGFQFNETPDQTLAIQAVRDDLASGRPMDRLIVGDVGYGKTEVALRAAALAALAGFQVILAAPTTVLVRQHLETFEQRFKPSGLKVAGLSRLSSAAEKKSVKAGLADGSIRIVIGTAAVMAKDVRYAKLGLVIIDEEQRFGASDKTKLRGRPDIHLMAMSATPIPRTLHRAIIGLQQISVIATPPARRQPIRTSLAGPDDAIIRTALLRERSRGGQSFIVVPRIEDLAPLCERLARIVPDLALITAHGKMPAGEIDEAMVRFGSGSGDVLLATNIIEAGLDVPRANTMVIWRADRFGLAQLHQLRGRVGRGNRRGQVFLITESGEIADRTMKRLRTLATFNQLGSGFEISAADLDQRGAGDPLAETQAGHMKLIGVDLYQHLFEAALKEARNEDSGLWMPELNLGDVGGLPPAWIPDAEVRLALYVRLARLVDANEADAFEAELCDRFGTLPAAAGRLIEAKKIAILAREVGIERIDAGPAAIALTPRDRKRPRPKTSELLAKGDRWILKERFEAGERLWQVAALLESLAPMAD
ncbi:transcription-repair coupling factor (superfamily II helicase) [Novosphingobium sp. PhB55]|uniref:DEAD/DEAH box helicase n=1 Tax=Novosphingobium sp. PhB55 TaxID=2485106 RepID=UPI001064BC52|nr:DEAD/DEAH box helicase [Novosphingobium sp. PhB55]TDW61535.1 transcription-repair coupling factor (superfamily II helicase) [Novosphingobium sp. PhB55]